MVDKATGTLQGLGLPQKQRLNHYKGNLSTDKDPNLFDKTMVEYLLSIARNPHEMEDELAYIRGTGYRQSKYDSKQMEDQIKRFEQPENPWFGWNRHYKAALNKLIREVETWHLNTLDYNRKDNIQDWIPRNDSHAGWSYIITGLRKKGEYRGNLLHDYNIKREEAKQKGSYKAPMLLGTRTQSSPPYNNRTNERTYDWKDKTRAVLMVDIFQVLEETRFAGPFQHRLGQTEWYAGGKSDRVQEAMIKKMRRRFSNWISLDYSKYDQSIPSWAIFDAFKVVRAAFKYDAHFDEEMFDIICRDFVFKAMVDGEGKLRHVKKGVPSGSMFTQIIDSVVNRIMIDTHMLSIGQSDYSLFIMGDDNLVYHSIPMENETLLSSMETYLDRNFGVKMNGTKSDFGDRELDPEFLSTIWRMEGRYRAPNVLLAKLIQPERWRDYKAGCDVRFIVQSYIDAYPLGMRELINVGMHDSLSLDYVKSHGGDRWLSGLQQYKIRFEKSKPLMM